jgi:hypothetical protein
MNYIVQICSVSMMYIISFIPIGYGMQVILGFLPQQFEGAGIAQSV